MSSTAMASTKDVDIASVGNMCIDIMLPINHYPISNGEHQRLRSGAFFEIGGSLKALISAARLKAKTAAIAYITGQREDVHPSDLLLSQYLRSVANGESIDLQGLVPHSRGGIPTCAALFDPFGWHTFLASNEDVQRPERNIECLPTVMENIVRKSKALVIDGYALHSDRELVRQCLHVAIRTKCAIWVDPQAATASLLRRKDDLFLQILASAHGISLNLHEAKILTGKEDLEDIVRTLPFSSSAKTILLKDGPHGCHAFAKTTNGDEICSAPGFDLGDTYRDSIGAGDAFIGAFLAGRLVHELGLRDCCILANAMAAATCMQHGAGASGIGSQAQVRQMISQGSFDAERVLRIL
ncbi:Carbohydrate kinase PfkB [Gracilaria domingensis]|nr:Carbohydrate kinase PfkB [Gracilaria domingensis]